VVNVAMLRQFDAKQTMACCLNPEFLAKFWLGPEKNLKIFTLYDKNNDGRWDWNEKIAKASRRDDSRRFSDNSSGTIRIWMGS